MAEQNLEITYIPYGQDEISQQDLMTNLANGVSRYLDSKRWARKDKYRLAWLSAYLNIIKAGLTGASNENGIWTVNHKGEAFPLENMSNIDREMYLDAAWYIQLQMAKMTPRNKLEEEKKEDENLEKFDFVKGFNTQLINNRYGGNLALFADSEEGWNSLDTRGENGLRGIDKRKEAMILELDSYLKGLEGKNYNFEGTSFTDINDAKTKILRAIDALKSEDINDDTPALNALGLPYKTYFSNGGNEASGYADKEGNQLTWNQYNKYQQELAELKTKADAEAAKLKLAQLRANQYTNFKFYQFNLAGTPLTNESSLNIINKLNSGEELDGNDISGLNWAFKQAIESGGLQNLSKEELSKFGSRYAGTPNRLKKLSGLNGVYYDSIANRIIRPYRLDQQQVEGTTLLTLIDLNSPEALAKKQEEKIELANNRKLSEGFQTEDYLRMGAMAQDITGAVAAWVPTYGTAISGGLGLSSLATNFAADWHDDSVSAMDMFKNAGINLGLAGVGMVPGLGLAAKSGKWLSNIAKWTPRILTLASAGHIALSDNIKNSLKKASSISDWNQLTNLDVKNITYALSTVAGLSRGTKGFINDRKFKPAFTENSEKQYTVTTSKGKKTITLELVDKIKKLNPKDKEKYSEELKKTLELADDETIDTKNLTAFGKTLKSKGVEIKEENVPIGLSSKAKAYRLYLENKNNESKENHKLLSKFVKTDYDIYKANTSRNIPLLSISDRLKNLWNPLSDRNLQRKGIKVAETSKTSSQLLSTQSVQQQSSKLQSTPPTKVPHSKNEIRKDWKNTIERKLFSTNEVKAGEYVITNPKDSKYNISFKVSEKDSNGSRTLTINGKKYEGIKTLTLLLEKIAKAILEHRSSVNNSKVKAGINHKEVGKILRELKAKGWLKQGGTINNSLDNIVEDFFKNNNI